MSDAGLRDLERRYQETSAPDDESRLLAERVRAGQISTQVLIYAALLGSKAAQIIDPEFRERALDILSDPEMDEALRLAHIPPRTQEFLRTFSSHDQEARATLTHYQLVQDGDKAPPDSATVQRALFEDLGFHPSHLEAIAQMQRPVLQLIPVYDTEGAGFQRMVNAIDAHPREGHNNTYVRPELVTRWGMNAQAPGKIVGWQVAVTEGAKILPRESNRFLEKDGVDQRAEDQLSQWQQYCREQGLQLCDNRSYALLSMQEIRLAPPETPLHELGLDRENVTYLGDRTRQHGALISSGFWDMERVRFGEYDGGVRRGYVRFRPSVVVKKIL